MPNPSNWDVLISQPKVPVQPFRITAAPHQIPRRIRNFRPGGVVFLRREWSSDFRYNAWVVDVVRRSLSYYEVRAWRCHNRPVLVRFFLASLFVGPIVQCVSWGDKYLRWPMSLSTSNTAEAELRGEDAKWVASQRVRSAKLARPEFCGFLGWPGQELEVLLSDWWGCRFYFCIILMLKYAWLASGHGIVHEYCSGWKHVLPHSGSKCFQNNALKDWILSFAKSPFSTLIHALRQGSTQFDPASIFVHFLQRNLLV